MQSSNNIVSKIKFLGIVILLFFFSSSLVQKVFNSSAAAFSISPKSSNLFIHLQPANVNKTSELATMRATKIDINFYLLEASKINDVITLNLFEDVTFNVMIDDIESNISGSVTWIGHVEGEDYSYVTLTVKDDVMVGNVNVSKQFYQIRYINNNTHVIYEANLFAFPQELEPLSELSRKPTFHDQENLINDPATTNPIMIDVMVIYTDDARQAAGSATAMENLIDTAIVETNGGYNASGISQRINLVHTSEVAYDESNFNWETTINHLTNPSDGFLDSVHTLRNNNNILADIVVLIVNNADACGIAKNIAVQKAEAFSVVSRSCATGNYSFAHEIGHLMGARHDWYVDPTDNAPYTYNHGYSIIPRRVRTIMAYNNECESNGFDCPRILRWSNPDKLWGGDPLGIPEGSYHASDNRKVLNNTAYTIANFRGCSDYSYSGITFFDNAYCGQQIKLQFSNPSDTINLSNYGWDNQASSIYIAEGWSVKVYEQNNASGNTRCVTGNMWDLSLDYYENSSIIMNESISSIEVFNNSSCAGDPSNPTPTPSPIPGDNTPPSANGFTASPSGGIANLSTSGVQDNAGGSGVREVRFSAKFNNKWVGIGVDSTAPYSLAWDMCASGVPDGDVELGMEVWDNANNVWIWSQHYGNPHLTKNHNCTPPPPAEGVTLYQNTGLGGSSCYITQDQPSIGNYCGSGWNDNAESVRVQGPYYFALYRDDWYGGGSPYTGNPTGDLPSEWRNQASSIRIRRNNPAAFTLYDLGDYNGESWASDRTIFDMGHWNWNDKAESIRVASGANIIVCEHSDFKGECGRATGPAEWSDINALEQGLRNSVSSIRVCSGACPSAGDTPTMIYPIQAETVNAGESVVLHWGGNLDQFYVELWGGGLSGTLQYGWTSNTSWDVGVLPASPNPYYWHVKGWRGYGETGWGSAGFHVATPDTTPPTGAMTAPHSGGYQGGPTVTLKATASDSGSGVNRLEFYAWLDDHWEFLGTDSSAPYTYSWDISAVPEGGVWVSADIIDNAGNHSGLIWEPDWSYFVIDKSPPSSAVIPLPTTQPYPQFTVRWSGNDNFTPNDLIFYDVQYQLNCTGSWNDWFVMDDMEGATFNGEEGQTYCFRSRAHDLVGNTEAWPSTADTQTTVIRFYDVYLPIIVNNIGLSSPPPTPTATPPPTSTPVSTATPSPTPTSTPVLQWHVETISDQGYNSNTSSDIGQDGTLHVAFRRNVGNQYKLWYGFFDGASWEYEPLYSDNTYPSLLVSSNNVPSVAEYGFFAFRINDQWEREYGSSGMGRSDLAYDGFGYPHMATYDSYNGWLRYGYKDTIWHKETVETDVDGGNVAIAIDANEFPHIIYKSGRNIKYAFKDATGWSSQTIVTATLSSMSFDIQIKQDNSVHIIYIVDKQATYAYKDSTGWQEDVLGEASELGVALAFNPQQSPCATFMRYVIGNTSNLFYACKVDGVWEFNVVDAGESGATGYGSSLVYDAIGQPHIFYTDQNGYLRHSYYGQ